LRICITGAAGQIAYSLLYSICKGDVFGTNQVQAYHIYTTFFMSCFLFKLLAINKEKQK